MNRGVLTAIIAVGLLIGGCSLAGDVTPPPALATAQMAETAEAPTIAPLIPPSTQPDLSSGAAIWADKCAPCHGPQGLGDGELAGGMAFAPAPLGDPEFARTADPIEWYRAVTVGNLDRLMPGFTSLTDQERWDVVGYAMSLGSQEIASETDDEQESDLDPEASTRTGTIAGKITNGTSGSPPPADLEVSLLGYDGNEEVVRVATTTEGDGSFKFEELEIVPGRLFFSTIVYDGLTYRSDVAHAVTDGNAIDLPITIFETTNNPSSMHVEQLHVIIDFPADDLMSVLELWVLGNDSDRVLTTPLQISLPEGATNLTFEDGTPSGRYEITLDGFADLEPIPPGTGIDHLVFGFDLPISRSTDFDQQMLHPVDAVTVLVPADGPRVSGLLDRGVQDIGGLRMQSFTTGALSPDEPLSFRVSAPSGNLLPAVVGAIALVVAALLALRVWRAAHPQAKPIGQDELVAAIAMLDDQFEAGQLSESDWGRQRDRLKRQALSQMHGSDD